MPSENHNPRISKIFYYFEKYTNISIGRTVGRKIGVVQEILCKKLLLQSQVIRDSVVFEPKIAGTSGATHKVEFVLFQPAKAFVVNSAEQNISFNGLNARVKKVGAGRVQLQVRSDEGTSTVTVAPGGLLSSKKVRALTEKFGVLLRVSDVNKNGVRIVVLNLNAPVASIESKRVGAQRFSGSDSLGSGIQTIEKAKQASLVAIDFDLAFNRELLCQGDRGRDRKFRSFVILGNGVHWTDHDLRILETYVDFTYLATDAAIIRYADFVRNLASERKLDFFPFFMSYFQGMTKTPPDAFDVVENDFSIMRPSTAKSLLQNVEAQVRDYEVIAIGTASRFDCA